MIFDANVALGRFAGSRGKQFSDASELLAAMDANGVSMGLVYGVLAREVDCARGNALLMEQIKGEERLVPCWVAVPGTFEFERLVASMKEKKVNALRLFPHSGHFSIRPWSTIAKLAELIERERMLLLIDFESGAWSDDSVDWEGVFQLCQAFSNMNVLMCGAMVAAPANYRCMLDKCPNLHVEISQMASPGEIPALIDAGFADRIVFGTALPIKHPGSIPTMLEKERISDDDYQKIVSDNLMRLLRMENPVSSLTFSENFGFVPERVVDAHAHLGGWNHSASGSGDADAILAEMDRCGINSAVPEFPIFLN